MNQGRTVFAQLTDFPPSECFHRCVHRYHGDRRVRALTCREQFLCMCFAQLTRRDSLRDVVTCLEAHQQRLHHMGLGKGVHRSTLADANEKRDWRIFADFAQELIRRARLLHAEDRLLPEIDERVYAIDATVVDLSLSLFPWAQFRRHKSAVKMHTVFDLQLQMPAFVHVTSARLHDQRFLDTLVAQPGAIYVMDRAYWAFERLYRLHRQRAYFIVRTRQRQGFARRRSQPVDRQTGLRSDQVGRPSNPRPRKAYPELIRRIHYRDPDTHKHFYWHTNHFDLPALTVAELYHRRWDIELFFRYLKQHLHIQSFFGTTPNAVKIQIWCAVATFVLIMIMRKQLHLDLQPYRIMQILSISPSAKVPLAEILTERNPNAVQRDSPNQLWLFDL